MTTKMTTKMTIPDNFNLGYACLCSCLRKNGIFSSRTLRIATIKTKGIDYIKELVVSNLNDLMKILIWNVDNNILFYRLSSEIFPFAAHLEHGYSLDFVDEKLKEIGKYANDNGMRLTYHPGQYNVLATESEHILQNTFRDLNHHCDVLDRMGMNQNSTLCIHGSGTYGNKPEALKRLEINLMRLPENTRNRIALENCEMSYCVEDLLGISEKLQIPLIIDFLHDDIHNSTEDVSFYFDRVFAVWNNRKIKPKVHVSNSIEGCGESKTARRKHSDYISFFQEALLKITFPIDVMLECKAKEQAIFRLRGTEIFEKINPKITKVTKVKVPVVAKVKVPVVAKVKVPVLSKVKVPVLSKVKIPVLSKVKIPVLSKVKIPVVSKVKMPVLSKVKVPVLSKVKIPVVSKVKMPVVEKVKMPAVVKVKVPVVSKVKMPVVAKVKMPAVVKVKVPVVSKVKMPVVAKVKMPVVEKVKMPAVVKVKVPVVKKMNNNKIM